MSQKLDILLILWYPASYFWNLPIIFAYYSGTLGWAHVPKDGELA